MLDSDDDADGGAAAMAIGASLFPDRERRGGRLRVKRKAPVVDGEEGADPPAARPEGKKLTADAKKKQKSTPFGGGGAKFADAFSKIISAAEDVKAEAASGPALAPTAAPILHKSRTVQRKVEEERQERLKRRQQRKRKRDLKEAGHQPPRPRGEDPAEDAIERRLLVTATRGVVQLFNAVNKVQRARKEAEEEGGHAKVKTTFVEELKRAAAAAEGGAAAEGAPAGGKQGVASGTGWDVLKEGFGHGRVKLKDWDQGLAAEGGEGGGADSDSGDE